MKANFNVQGSKKKKGGLRSAQGNDKNVSVILNTNSLPSSVFSFSSLILVLPPCEKGVLTEQKYEFGFIM